MIIENRSDLTDIMSYSSPSRRAAHRTLEMLMLDFGIAMCRLAKIVHASLLASAICCPCRHGRNMRRTFHLAGTCWNLLSCESCEVMLNADHVHAGRESVLLRIYRAQC